MRVPPIISYAQNFEDVILWRALGHVKNGFYIDVGAQDPIVDSVSLAFYEHGWRGMHIEPTHHYATLLRQHRPEETVLETAVGAEAGIIRFYEIPDSGISTADEGIAEKHRERGFTIVEINVPCVTLASVFKSCARKDVHWLKIDVEGLEEQVLAGWTPSKVRPWVVVVESTLPLTQVESYESWEPLLLSYGYSYVYFDGLNRFYVSDKKKGLRSSFRAPPNVFDGFSISDTTSTSVHRVLVDRYKNQIDSFSASVAEHASRERSALAAAEDIQKSAQAELAQSLLEQEAQAALLREKSEIRERELVNIFTASQGESARYLDSLAQQSAANRADAVTAREQSTSLQQTLAAREREIAEQLVHMREDADRRLVITQEEFETRSRELISSNLQETAQREQLFRAQIEARRAENEALLQRMNSRESVYIEELALAKSQAQRAASAQWQEHEHVLRAEVAAQRDAAERSNKVAIARERVLAEEFKRANLVAIERERGLVAKVQHQTDALQAELKTKLIQMINQERVHSENILRLNEDAQQKLEKKSDAFIERENILRAEFSVQISSQSDSFEKNKIAALQREHELIDLLAVEKQAYGLLDDQLNAATRQVEAARQYEAVLQHNLSSYSRQIALYQSEISFIQNTLSWRLTAPIRQIARWMGWRHFDRELSALGSASNKTFEQGAETALLAAPPDNSYCRNLADKDESQPAPSYFAEHPMTNINHIQQLLELHDVAFVHQAYLCLLDRAADSEGEVFYLTRLRSGIAKADIIFEIAQSEEGKRKDVDLAGLREFVAAHPTVRSNGFRGAFVRLKRIERQVNRLENELARASAGHAQAGKAIQDKLQDLESLLHTINDANDQRVRKMESALTAIHVASTQQVVAAFEKRLDSLSGDVCGRLNQVEAAVTNLNEGIAQQANKIIAAHVDSIRARLDSSVEPPLRFVQKEQLMREIESWTTAGLVDART